MELSKNDTKMLQGLSVVAMVCLHLFSRNYIGLYEPLLFIHHVPVCFCLSQLSDFCVFGFAFCSGYAHMKLFDVPNYYKKRLRGLTVLIINFWLILFGSTIISVIIGTAGYMPESPEAFFGTMFLFDMHFNGAWWYLWAYTLLVLLSPLLLRVVKKAPFVPILAVSFLIYCIAFYVRFQISTSNWFLLHFGPFGMTFFEYILGCVAAKYMVITKLRGLSDKIPLWLRISLSCVSIVLLFFARTFLIPSVFFAPFSGFVIFAVFILWRKPKWVETTFLFLGKHSTNIWLTHMFFVASLWVYIAKYPLLIFAFLLLISVPISFVISFLLKGVTKVMKKLWKTV